MAGNSRLRTAMDNTDEHFKKLNYTPELGDDELDAAIGQVLSEDQAVENTLSKRRARTREVLEKAFTKNTLLMESEIGRDREPVLPKINLKSSLTSTKPKVEPINRRWIDPRIIENTKQGQDSKMAGEIVTGNGTVADTRDAAAVAASVITSGEFAGMTKSQALAQELAENEENPLQLLRNMREGAQRNIAALEAQRVKIAARMKVEVAAIAAEHKAIEEKKNADIDDLRAQIKRLNDQIATKTAEIAENSLVCKQRIQMTDDERDNQLENIDLALEGQKNLAGTIAAPIKSKKARISKTIES